MVSGSNLQPVPHPSSSLLIKSISFHLRDDDVEGDCVKGLTEIQVGDISGCCYVIIEGRCVGKQDLPLLAVS